MNTAGRNYDGMGSNPKDPMSGVTPENERRLLREFGKLATGASNEVVLGAAMNLVCNVLRQSYPTFDQAMVRLDDRVGVMKNILRASYDQVTGKRKSVFPFDQVIRPGLLNMKDDTLIPPGTKR